MHRVILCALAAATLATPAIAEARYDRQLEKAAMEIIARTIGDLRDGFDFNEKPIFIVVQDMMTTESIPANAVADATEPTPRDWDWKYGAALLSERVVSRVVY